MSAIELTSFTAASSDKMLQMLVNGIMKDDQSMVNVAQAAIKVRSEAPSVQYTANVDRIASGLNSTGVQQRETGTDFGVA